MHFSEIQGVDEAVAVEVSGKDVRRLLWGAPAATRVGGMANGMRTLPWAAGSEAVVAIKVVDGEVSVLIETGVHPSLGHFGSAFTHDALHVIHSFCRIAAVARGTHKESKGDLAAVGDIGVDFNPDTHEFAERCSLLQHHVPEERHSVCTGGIVSDAVRRWDRAAHRLFGGALI